MEYDVVLYPIALLRPSEEVNMAHVEALTKEIVRCQRWTTPIPIEKETELLWTVIIGIKSLIILLSLIFLVCCLITLIHA